jgi:hypothetical protein
VLFWRPGEPGPYQFAWFRPTTGGLQRPIAALAGLPDGRLLVVERFGRVVAIAPNNTLTAKMPLLGRFNVKGGPGEDWGKNVVSSDHVAAAAVAQDGRLYLASDSSPMIVGVKPINFLADESNAIILSFPRLHMIDQGTLVLSLMQVQPPAYSTQIVTPLGNGDERFSALAVCGDTIVAGSSTGVVYFVPVQGDQEDARVRQLAEAGQDPADILDAGCLADGLVYTVSFQTGNGQIQLWDLASRRLLDSVDVGPGRSSPLITIAAVASANGTQLLGLGDLGLRLLDVRGRRLTEVGHIDLDNIHFTYAAGPYDNGFLVFDGERLRQLSSDGNSLISLARPPGAGGNEPR